jgi:alpha-L-rhamnosidase
MDSVSHDDGKALADAPVTVDAADACALSVGPVPVRDGWRELVVNPGPFAVPRVVEVLGAAGEAERADALCVEGGETARLVTSARHSCALVVDLGVLAFGYLEMGVVRASGAAIRVAHAQFRERLGVDGDGYGVPTDRKPSAELGPLHAFPFGTDAHPWSRVDLFEAPSERVVLESEGRRESRFLLITLDGPGELELDFVRIRQALYPVRYDGHFLCSDELVSRAWYHSAYTQDISTVSEKSELEGACHSGPDGASPWMVTVPMDRVLFFGDVVWQSLSGYNQSSDFWWLLQNSLSAYPRIQNPDGSFPCASSHLVKPPDEDTDLEAPPTGWRWPDDGPDPDLALGILEMEGFGGPYSLFHECRLDQFTPAWLSVLAGNFLYSGDAEFVRPLMPVARRVVGFFRSMLTPEGLYFEPEDQRVNPEAEVARRWNWDPAALSAGIDAYTNAAWYDAIRGLALLEEHVAGDAEAAARLRDEAEALREALLERLWDPEVGAMILNDQDPLRDHTSDANAMQLCFGTLDGERAQALMSFLERKLWTPFGTRNSEYDDNPYRPTDAEGGIHAFMTSMEQLGRMRYRDGQRALELIRRQWRHMLDHGPGTGWFTMALDGSPGSQQAGSGLTSWTTAVPALSEGVLGIRPTAPGFSRWIVAPQPCDLEWAQGAVPTPHGELSVRWQRTDRSFVLSVDAPPNTQGDIVVPLLGRPRSIAIDGTITPGQPHDDTVTFTNLHGQHTLAWTD